MKGAHASCRVVSCVCCNLSVSCLHCDSRRLYATGAAKKTREETSTGQAVADTSKILSFFLTTMAGEDETSECNPENSKRDAVDVAPSVPAPEDETTAEPAPENEAAAEPTTAEPATAEPTTAEPTTAEPARRGPVVQELDLTLDNTTGRALFQLGTLLISRTGNGNYSSRSMPPKRTVSLLSAATFS